MHAADAALGASTGEMDLQEQIDGATEENDPLTGGTELRSLVRGIRILDLFLDPDTEECRVDHLVDALGVPTSTAYRLVRVLRQHGLLEDGSARGTFRLGAKLRWLGERARTEDGLLARIRPLLEDLAQETGETVLFTLRQGDEAIHVEVIDSREEVRVFIPRGKRMHIAAGGSGRVILAYLRPREIDRILAQPLPAYTEHTLTDAVRIRAELEAIRLRGYAISESQTTADTRGICLPLRGRTGEVLGSVTATGPAFRMSDAKVEQCLAATRRLVARMSG